MAASMTAAGLLGELTSQKLLSEAEIVSALGPERHGAKLDAVELALVRSGAISNTRLEALKAALTGLPVADDRSSAVAGILPAAIAKQCGALALAGERPAVAFVEDTPDNVERVKAVLGRDFDVWLVTTPRFVEMYKEAYQNKTTDTRPVVKDIYEILDEAVSLDASDVHLSVDSPPILRVNGDLVAMHKAALSDSFLRDAVERLTGERGLTETLSSWNADSAFPYGSVRFRVNAGADMHGLTLALRRLPSKIPTFDELSLPTAVRNFADLERGLVLVTGPTGSGKSTTLAAILSHISRFQPRHVITLEDPIEFVLPQGRALVQQRELGQSFPHFPGGVRQSLRQDPDVVLVGEARDPETVRAAVTSAETGALVFATVHTYDAVSTLARIVSTYPDGEQDQIRNQLAYVLKGVVSQTLVPAITGGRIAAYEILVVTPAVSNNLRKVDGLMSLRQVIVSGTGDGMQTMESHLAQLVRQGLVRETDAEFKARDLDEFRRQLKN